MPISGDRLRFVHNHGDVVTNMIRMYHSLSRFLKSWTVGTKDRDSVTEATLTDRPWNQLPPASPAYKMHTRSRQHSPTITPTQSSRPVTTLLSHFAYFLLQTPLLPNDRRLKLGHKLAQDLSTAPQCQHVKDGSEITKKKQQSSNFFATACSNNNEELSNFLRKTLILPLKGCAWKNSTEQWIAAYQ